MLFLLYEASSNDPSRQYYGKVVRLKHSLDASLAIRSKISFTKELRIAIALFDIPVSGCTCLSTRKHG